MAACYKQTVAQRIESGQRPHRRNAAAVAATAASQNRVRRQASPAGVPSRRGRSSEARPGRSEPIRSKANTASASNRAGLTVCQPRRGGAAARQRSLLRPRARWSVRPVTMEGLPPSWSGPAANKVRPRGCS